MPALLPTLGVILAGGRATRMGGADKTLLRLEGHTLLSHVTERLAPQCDCVIISANGDPARFDEARLPIVPDSLPDQPGPLAGILAAMEWAAARHPHIPWVVSVPGDTPCLPPDLVPHLHQAREAAGTPLACAVSGSRVHPAVGLWPVHLRRDLRQVLTTGHLRSVRGWADLYGVAHAQWPSEPFDPFFNINTPEDLAEAEAQVGQHREHSRDGSMIELDLSGLKCPLPVLKTRKALGSLQPGKRVRVVCTDPLAGIDIPNLIRETGDVIEEQRQDGRALSFVIRKSGQHV